VRGEAEHGLEGNVPIEAAVITEDKLVEIGVDVLSAQAVVSAQPPPLHQREDPVNPRQHDVTRHLADRPRVVTIVGEPGIGSMPIGQQGCSGFHVGPHKGFE